MPRASGYTLVLYTRGHHGLLIHTPTPVHFQRHGGKVLGSELIVDSCGERCTKSLACAGTESQRGKQGRRAKGKVSLGRSGAVESLACHNVGGFY